MVQSSHRSALSFCGVERVANIFERFHSFVESGSTRTWSSRDAAARALPLRSGLLSLFSFPFEKLGPWSKRSCPSSEVDIDDDNEKKCYPCIGSSSQETRLFWLKTVRFPPRFLRNLDNRPNRLFVITNRYVVVLQSFYGMSLPDRKVKVQNMKTDMIKSLPEGEEKNFGIYFFKNLSSHLMSNRAH